MAEKVKIAIIGSGPGGMSAAGHAAELGVSHILLERTDHLSDTIFKYQKGKHVMATPDILPLRSPMEFAPGTREAILGSWDETTINLDVNVRYNAEVTGIEGERGSFKITVNNNDILEAEAVILAIGLQGNLRRLDVPGADWERVQYQLDDPDEYEDETIVVVGTGDAGIENAVALAGHNNVIVINRGNEFATAKDGNVALILSAIEEQRIQCYYESSPESIKPGELTLKTSGGQEIIACDRIIARIGAVAPRRFVEACGIEFPSEDRTALPVLTPQYESNVPGLYIIGALGGYPLIKQAMNQGYEVVEFIEGNNVKPADEPILEERFGALASRFTVDETIDWFRESVPLLSVLTPLQLRELLLDSTVHLKQPKESIFQIGEFGDTVYMIVEGVANVHIDPDDMSVTVPLEAGSFFGEVAMVSAQPRSATVSAGTECVLVEVPRRTMIKMMKSVRPMRKQLQEMTMIRQLRVYLSQDLTDDIVQSLIETADRREYNEGQPLFHEGEEADGVYIIKKGAVTMSRSIGGQETMLDFTTAGKFVGEKEVVEGTRRQFTARAASKVNATWIEDKKFLEVSNNLPDFRDRVERQIVDSMINTEVMAADREAGNIMHFLVEHGVSESTDVLLIDETLCVACNNCEVACAETHGGISRLARESGPTFGRLHLPHACRHCEDPYCMADCPPNAIQRSPNGEVFIDDTCIGCGNCHSNCPYNAITMSSAKQEKPGLLSWLLFGSGGGPGGAQSVTTDDDGGAAPKFARKCDSCMDIEGGPSCVRACPTGAAFRAAPGELFKAEQLAR